MHGSFVWMGCSVVLTHFIICSIGVIGCGVFLVLYTLFYYVYLYRAQSVGNIWLDDDLYFFFMNIASSLRYRLTFRVNCTFIIWFSFNMDWLGRLICCNAYPTALLLPLGLFESPYPRDLCISNVYNATQAVSHIMTEIGPPVVIQ
jgi:hypothetical protein